jgi:hypothetical protein
MPACANPHAIAIDPSAVTAQDSSEIAPAFAMLVGSMMMPDPIMLIATMKGKLHQRHLLRVHNASSQI